MDDPHGIVGMEVPHGIPGDNFGHRVLAYDNERKSYLVQPIIWSSSEPNGDLRYIHPLKLWYRYDLSRARPSSP